MTPEAKRTRIVERQYEKVMKARCECCYNKNLSKANEGWCFMHVEFELNCKLYDYEMSDADHHHSLTGE